MVLLHLKFHQKMVLIEKQIRLYLSCIIVVHTGSRDVEDCGGAPRRKFTLKPAKIPYNDMAVLAKPKKAFRLILLKRFQKVATEFFFKKLFNRISYWLTNCLPDAFRLAYNSTMAKATGLIFSLFNVASAREVPFLPCRCTCNAFFMDLPRPSFHLFSPRKVSIAHDGFHLLRKSSVVATLITKVLFKQLLICTAK